MVAGSRAGTVCIHVTGKEGTVASGSPETTKAALMAASPYPAGFL
ncbi:hypothetical protein SXCC_01617 [Gluconacetobacter sp. SXCC-1]|nr:hypothetical protein SXCC_01617 [Gluconacetobacter sp. SXCC-1]